MLLSADSVKYNVRNAEIRMSQINRMLKAKRMLVPISDVWFSDFRAIWFVRLFGYAINIRNPKVRLVEFHQSERLKSWEWDNF